MIFALSMVLKCQRLAFLSSKIVLQLNKRNPFYSAFASNTKNKIGTAKLTQFATTAETENNLHLFNQNIHEIGVVDDVTLCVKYLKRMVGIVKS